MQTTTTQQLSEEQKKVLFEVMNPKSKFLKILAIAGSGKTFLLKAITDIVKPKNALYLAYNKAIAVESSKKFNRERVTCSTTHSLAYHHIVKRYGYVIGTDITGRSITAVEMIFPDEISKDEQKLEYYRHYIRLLKYERKDLIAAIICKFLLSKHIKILDFIQDEFLDFLEPEEITIASAYVNMMKNKKVPITHSFYLKMLHIFMHLGKIKINEYDLVMLDEAGDINPVTLEIYKLIQCDKKIMVGDDQQNIYSFNATINGFKETEGEGSTFDLSKSFRVSQDIAVHVESFCKKYLNPKMSFAGVYYKEEQIVEEKDRTIAFIFRTNAGLVDKMLDLERNNKPYNITRSVESLFRIHRAIIFCKPGGVIHDPDLQFIQHDCDEWDSSDELKRRYSTFIGYLRYKNENNIQVKTAIQTILKYTGRTILEIYKQAKAHEETSGNHQITLTTAHASKGCEYDIVHLGEDLNEITMDLIKKYEVLFKDNKQHPSDFLRNSELEEFRLYYVAGTRAKLKLYNAKLFSNDYIIQDKNLQKELKNGTRSMA